MITSICPQAKPQAHSADLSPWLPRLKEFRDELHQQSRAWVLNGVETIARPAKKKQDEYVYSVDVGQLMWFYAMMGDVEPYLALREFAVRHLIVDIPNDPYTKGFVLWRCVPNSEPDSSGTTEALRIARALWDGAAKFNRPEDRALAMTILDGYSRHANVDQGIWIIRNYFHFRSRSMASNTFVIDYDPDFVREVAEGHKSDAQRYAELSALADNSYGILKRAVAPSGLLYDLVQPELKTMYYGLDVTAFSPNDIIQTNNACTTAATIAKGAPEVARGVLSFFTPRADKIFAHYYGRAGEAVHKLGIGATEYASLVRLAALLGENSAVAAFIKPALPFWEQIVAQANPGKVWTASEMMIGLQAVLEIGP